MSAHLLQLQAEAHARDLTEQARQARLARLVRTSHRRPGRLRASIARVLLSLAVRLDNRVQPPLPRATPCGSVT
jgi:hypothetical protein